MKACAAMIAGLTFLSRHNFRAILGLKVAYLYHRKRLGWDSETCGEKNPSHMENNTKYISVYLHVSVRSICSVIITQ